MIIINIIILSLLSSSILLLLCYIYYYSLSLSERDNIDKMIISNKNAVLRGCSIIIIIDNIKLNDNNNIQTLTMFRTN